MIFTRYLMFMGTSLVLGYYAPPTKPIPFYALYPSLADVYKSINRINTGHYKVEMLLKEREYGPVFKQLGRFVAEKLRRIPEYEDEENRESYEWSEGRYDLNADVERMVEGVLDRVEELELSMKELLENSTFVDRIRTIREIWQPGETIWTSMFTLLRDMTEDNADALVKICQHKGNLKIVKAINNRLEGDNGIMQVNLRFSHYHWKTFRDISDIIYYRLFQTLISESMCFGISHEADRELSNHTILNAIHDSIDKTTYSFDKMSGDRQKLFWPSSVQHIIREEAELTEDGNNYQQHESLASRILQSLDDHYPWSKFSVLVYDGVNGYKYHAFLFNTSQTLLDLRYNGRNIIVHRIQKEESALIYEYKKKKHIVIETIRENYLPETSLMYQLETVNKIFSMKPKLIGLILEGPSNPRISSSENVQSVFLDVFKQADDGQWNNIVFIMTFG